MSEHPTLEELSAYFDSPEEAEEGVRQHVLVCDVCEAYGRQLEELDSAIAGFLSLQPPDGAWAQIEAQLERRGVVGRRTSLRERISTWSSSEWALPQLAAAAIALAVFAGGMVTGRLLETGTEGQTATSLESTMALGELLPSVEMTRDDTFMAKDLVVLEALAAAARDALDTDPTNPVYSAFAVEVSRRTLKLREVLEGEASENLSPSRQEAIRDSVVDHAYRVLTQASDIEWRDNLISESVLYEGRPFYPTLLGARLEPLTAELAAYFPGVEAGVLVLDIADGTVLDVLGVLPGDVLVSVASAPIATPAELRRILREERPDDGTMTIEWIRQGTTMSAELTANPGDRP